MKTQAFTLTQENIIYLDHNATTPLAQSVFDSIPEWSRHWGNPSSIHLAGRGPKSVLRDARKQFADLIGSHPLELIFTSGGSESNNLAIQGVLHALQTGQLKAAKIEGRKKFLYSAVEHPSVVQAMQFAARLGFDVQTIPVLRCGRIDMEALKSLLDESVALVSVMYANNETGNIYPVREIADLVHGVGALFHCDMVQALGKAEFNIKELDVDFASFSAHKFYALKGCGVLFCRTGLVLESLIQGGGQERGRRAGTENILAIAALAKMSEYKSDILKHLDEMKVLRDDLEAQMKARIEGVLINGEQSARLPNTTSAIIPGVDGESLLMNLDLKGFAVSTGAACSSGNPEPSPVLLAMGLSRAEAQSSLRVGLGWGTTKEQIDAFVEALVEVTNRLRSLDQEGQYV